jgi:microcystin-dependent protein
MDQYIGEIRMFGGTFAPVGWALCTGQLLSISENAALFTLIGTTYGGDGVNTFALPNLQSRIPVHQGPGYVMGQLSGTETVTLTGGQIPSHSHPANGTSASASSSSPANNLYASGPTLYAPPVSPPSPLAAMASQALLPNTGGGQPHSNVMPFQVVTFIIALQGLFPTQN